VKSKKKIYELEQISNSEGGSTCFCMVAGYYKKWISLEEAYKRCCGTHRGCSKKGISFAAKELNFDSEIINTDFNNLGKYTLPLIICVNNTDYMVLEGIKKSTYYLCDPKNGRVAYKEEDLASIFDGFIITMTPNKDFTPAKECNNGFRYGAKILKNNKKEVMLYSIGLAMSAVFSTLFPKLNATFANEILGAHKSPKRIILLFILLLTVSLFLQIYNVRYCGKIYKKISASVNKKFVNKLFDLPLLYYDIRNPGDLTTRKTDNQTVTKFITTQFCDFIIKAVMVVICLAIIGTYSLVMLFAILLTTLLMYAVTTYSTKIGSKINRNFFSSLDRMNDYTYDVLASITTIRNAGADAVFMKKMIDMNNTSCMAKKKRINYVSIITNLPNCLADLTKLLIVALGTWLAVYYDTPLETIVAIIGFFSIIYSPLQDLTNIKQSFSTMEYSLDRVSAINESLVCKRVEGDSENSDERIFGDIVLNNVNFGYVKHEEPFIKNLNMTIHQGEHIAIVGASAGGKTTIKRLIMGELEPDSGKITYAGKLRSEIPDKVFVRSFGAVDQSIMLFPDTVMNNIKMWNNDITDYASVLAARDAEIYDLIMGRPNGFDGLVEEKGKNFSGGERQRIEIARALSLDPSFLILDEATSALDAVVEKKVANRCLERGITTIIIAHRLSTIRNCDRIFVVDKGKIVASGTHDELLESCSIYNDLVTKE